MPTSIFVKFRAHLSHLRQIQKIEPDSVADIPQIEVVASVVLAMVWADVRRFLLRKRC